MAGMKDYNRADGDRHANQRDKKRDKRMQQRLMRGNRSVFEIQKAIVKRGKEAKGEK